MGALSGTRTARAMRYIAHSAATGAHHASIHIHNVETILGMEHLISPEVTKFMLQQRMSHVSRVLTAQREQRLTGVDSSSPSQESAIVSSFSKEWYSRILELRKAGKYQMPILR